MLLFLAEDDLNNGFSVQNSAQGVFEFLFQAFLWPGAGCCSKLVSATGALPIMDGYMNLVWFGVWGGAPFFDKVLAFNLGVAFWALNHALNLRI